MWVVLAGCFEPPASSTSSLIETCTTDGSGCTDGNGDGKGSDAAIDGAVDAQLDAPTPTPTTDAPVCTIEPPPLPTAPNLKRKFELKGSDAVPGSDTVAEIKLGVEINSEGTNGPPGTACEATSKASLLGYLFVTILGQEQGVSISGNGAQKVCKTKTCTSPPNFSCGAPQCESGTVGGSVAVYRGVEWKLCDKLKKLGWVGAQICKYTDVKATARFGIGANARVDATVGVPAGSCTACCANGNSVGSLEAGPSGLLEGKAAAKFKLWRLEIEAGLGAKGCASLQGKVGTQCDGSAFAEPALHYYAAVCVESMVAPGVSFRVLNNDAQVCIPLGFWEKCFNIPRCWKTDTDPSRACPSGSPNPE